MPRHVMIVAYDFPPFAHVASHRPAKLARDLEGLGWRATVITPGTRPELTIDRATLRWIPSSARVVRVPRSPLRWGMGFLNRLAPGGGAVAGRWLVPDPEVGWVPAAVAAAWRVARRDRPEALWTTCGPNSVALAGAALAQALRVPWVLDLCNEWTGNPYFAPPTALHRRAHAALEHRLIAAADAVTTLNPAHTELLARADPFRPQRYRTIEGGVDLPEPPVEAKRAAPSGPMLTFTYAGSVYGLQGPEPLLDALEGLVASGALPAADVRVRLVGSDYREDARRCAGVSVVREGRLPHDRIAGILASSDVLFLCLSKRIERQLPTKLYEYLLSGRPILAVVPPDSVAARRVRERGVGWVVAAEDREGLAKTVASIYDAWRRGRLPSHDGAASVAPFTRACMARTLSELLEDVIRVRRRGADRGSHIMRKA